VKEIGNEQGSERKRQNHISKLQAFATIVAVGILRGGWGLQAWALLPAIFLCSPLKGVCGGGRGGGALFLIPEKTFSIQAEKASFLLFGTAGFPTLGIAWVNPCIPPSQDTWLVLTFTSSPTLLDLHCAPGLPILISIQFPKVPQLPTSADAEVALRYPYASHHPSSGR